MIYYIPAVHLTSTLAVFSGCLGLRLSKYVFILKLYRMLYGCKSSHGGAHCERERTGKRAAPDIASAASNLIFTALAACVLL